MKQKRTKVIFGAVLAALLLLAAAAFLLFKLLAPPGEEWLAYGNERIIASIDAQLAGLDAEGLAAEKESLVLEKTVEELQGAVARGELTYEELTAICLYRIKTLDQSHHGYNSVMEVAPDALEQARAKDAQRLAAGQEGGLPPLFGIPVMLKDNINTAGIPTSAGAVAFADFTPRQDAPLVQALREQGAVILGKNNLAEFAYYVSSTMPNGYSGKKGQAMNPFGPRKISPSGSSSGSAVAVSANLAPLSIGTETAGSIVGPAAANSVVGFKPTRESVPGEGIFPLIKKIDTAGPMARTVQDAALGYAAISGQAAPELNAASLKGAAVGLAVFGYEDEAMVAQLRTALEQAGARVVNVELDQGGVEVQNIIQLSFKQDFEEFARRYEMPITDLGELIEYNRADAKRRARYGQDHLEAANAVQAPDPARTDASIQNAQASLDGLFAGQGLDAVAFLNTAGSTVASAAGYPELCVPLGLDKKGAPQGATFVMPAGQDAALLNLGYAFQQAVRGRRVP